MHAIILGWGHHKDPPLSSHIPSNHIAINFIACVVVVVANN